MVKGSASLRSPKVSHSDTFVQGSPKSRSANGEPPSISKHSSLKDLHEPSTTKLNSSRTGNKTEQSNIPTFHSFQSPGKSSFQFQPGSSESPGQWRRNKNDSGSSHDVELFRSFVFDDDSAITAKFSNDGNCFAVGMVNPSGFDGAADIYDLKTGTMTRLPIESQVSRKSGVSCLCFSPDNTLLAIGHFSGLITLWLGASKGYRFGGLGPSHEGQIIALDFSPIDLFLVSTSVNDALCIWSVDDDCSSKQLSNKNERFCCAKFSPNKNIWHIVACNLDGRVAVWDYRTHQLLGRWIGHDATISDMTFTPDGNTLVTSSWDHTVKCWNIGTNGRMGELIREFKSHTNRVHSVAVSPDGRWLLSASKDGTVRFSNMSNGSEEYGERILHNVRFVDVCPTGNYFLLVEQDGLVGLWRRALRG